MSKDQNFETGVKTFLVGGVERELKFNAALRFRLFLNISNEQIQNYVTSEVFKLTALALLFKGKEGVGMSTEQVIDLIEELDLENHEMEAIVGWVRERALNFILAEAQETAKALQQLMPQAKALSSSLTGSQV